MERNNSEIENDKSKNWLLAFGVILFFSLPVLIFFQIAIAISGSINPLKWNKQIIFLIFYFAAILGVSLVNYLEQTGKTKNIFKKFVSLTNVSEYENKTPLDAFLSHYANVATIGLLWGLATYTYRSFNSGEPIVQILILALFASIIVILILFYSLMMLKLIDRLTHLKNIFFYIVILIVVFFVDAKAFEMIIKSVPSASLHAAKAN